MKKALLTIILTAIVSATFAQWNTSGTNIYNSNTGNVGIGTTAPGAKLNIAGSTEALRLTGTGTTGVASIGYMSFYDSNNTTTYGFLGDASNVNSDLYFSASVGGLNFGTGGANGRMYINSSGFVGIGTTSPNTLLNIYGTGSNSNGLLNVQSSDAGARGTLMRTGFYEYNSQDNSGNYFQSWGMRLNGSDNLWYRTYTSANNYLPYTQLTPGGTIVFGGAVSNLTTDANPTLSPFMTINVGTKSLALGTTDPKTYMLAVNGSAIATSMTVKLNGNWPDYVFKKDYQLPALSDIKSYIDQNHHLPDMPSEQEVADKGLNLGEINKQLTKKVEELTLYLIDKDKKDAGLQAQLGTQQKEIDELKAQLKLLIEKSK